MPDDTSANSASGAPDPVAALRKKLAETGSISSSDVAAMGAGQETESAQQESAADAAPKLSPDPLAVAAGELITVDDWAGKPVAITAEDREVFKHAVATMTRFTRRVSLFNGGMTVTFRTRTMAESDAIANWQRLLVTHAIVPQEAFQTHLRAGLLAAQVERLNGEALPPLAEPLLARPVPGAKAGGAQFIAPAWHAAAVARWANKLDPGMLNEIMRELYEFERVYYALLEGARNQNFSPTAAST